MSKFAFGDQLIVVVFVRIERALNCSRPLAIKAPISHPRSRNNKNMPKFFFIVLFPRHILTPSLLYGKQRVSTNTNPAWGSISISRPDQRIALCLFHHLKQLLFLKDIIHYSRLNLPHMFFSGVFVIFGNRTNCCIH